MNWPEIGIVSMLIALRKLSHLSFQFGRMTTPGDCKASLKERVDKQRPATGRKMMTP
jgi:hypothetical protein